MVDNNAHVAATFYAQVEPEWPYGAGPSTTPTGAKVARISKNRPDRPLGGTVLVKLTIHVPKSAFMPLRPEAVVMIPESMTEPQPVHVEALDPHEENDG